ncbi:hypothetical protein [Streptomyces anulatus]|uniref:hypothetical protein n=1 Tax=Streptomyces anulatus TaxID=1892 RepID=UPI0038703A47|nr:hypothetical protein OG882_04705 [Streptomyces anulatus]
MTSIVGEPGRTYRLLSCALRNKGTGWQIINDAGHRPTGITGVIQRADHLELTHVVGAVKVSSHQVSVDETFAAEGLRVGSSVGFDLTRVYLYTGCPCVGPSDPVDPATVSAASGNLWVTAYLEVPA